MSSRVQTVSVLVTVDAREEPMENMISATCHTSEQRFIGIFCELGWRRIVV